jgi:predicted unusual protein kinase regulating ubiquinone biosynthesis (AarF/ABC1/UbiB family)
MKPDGKPQLHFLDCGLVVEVGPHQHVNMIKILGAFTRKNGRLAGQLMVDTSSDSQASEWDVEMFVSGIERITKMDDDQVSPMTMTINCSYLFLVR